jgi:hypothetical protein
MLDGWNMFNASPPGEEIKGLPLFNRRKGNKWEKYMEAPSVLQYFSVCYHIEFTRHTWQWRLMCPDKIIYMSMRTFEVAIRNRMISKSFAFECLIVTI